jgi:hypothetical protein
MRRLTELPNDPAKLRRSAAENLMLAETAPSQGRRTDFIRLAIYYYELALEIEGR